MGLVKGKNMILTLGDSVIAASRECSISIESEIIETASQSAKAREFIPGRYGFSISATGLYAIGGTTVQSYDLVTTLLAGTKVAFAYEAENTSTGKTDIYTGSAYVQSIEFSGATGSFSTYSIQMQGTGVIEPSQVTRDDIAINPVFAYIDVDGNESSRISSGNTFELDFGELIDETQGGYGFTLRIYPRMTNHGTSISDITPYISQFITDLRATDTSSGTEMQIDTNISKYSDHIDILIEQQEWHENLFRITTYPDMSYNVEFSLL